MLGANVSVEAVGQGIVERANMPPRAASGLEHDDLVPALHQVVAAGETCDAGSDHDHFLGNSRLSGGTRGESSSSDFQKVTAVHVLHCSRF